MSAVPPTTDQMQATIDYEKQRRRRNRNLRNHPVECKRRRVKFSRLWAKLDNGDWIYRG